MFHLWICMNYVALLHPLQENKQRLHSGQDLVITVSSAL